MLKADLHLHTNASDGRFSPTKLVLLAKKQKIDIIAVTDHDTINGIEEALAFGLKSGIKVIPGIELSTTHNGESIHLLGYFNENHSFDALSEYMLDMQNRRVIRGEKIVSNLKKYFNINIDYKKIVEESKGIIARPHIAKAIVDAGYDYSWKYIFDTMIGDNSPAYVENKKLSLPEGIQLLKSSGALTVLAHPVLIKKSSTRDLLHYNIDGIEAIYYLNSAQDTRELLEMAKENNLLITAGSDFHGYENGDEKHPPIIGAVSLDGNYLKLFLESLQKL